MIDYAIVLLFVWVPTSWLIAGGWSAGLYLWARGQGAPVSFLLSGGPRFTLRTYVQWCRDRGKPVDPRLLRCNRVVSTNFRASLVGFIAIFVLVALRQRVSGGP